MFEVLKIFYTTHYNFGAVAILLLLLLIFLLSKKNFKFAIIVGILLIAMNVGIYKRTEGRSWTIEIDPPAEATSGYSSYDKPQPIKMTFSVHKNWTITDDKGNTYHWCWVDEYWDKFSNTDIVAWIWGENASKKMTKSTESRADAAQNAD